MPCDAAIVSRTHPARSGALIRTRDPTQPIAHPVDRLSPEVTRPPLIVTAAPAPYRHSPHGRFLKFEPIDGRFFDHLAISHAPSVRRRCDTPSRPTVRIRAHATRVERPRRTLSVFADGANVCDARSSRRGAHRGDGGVGWHCIRGPSGAPAAPREADSAGDSSSRRWNHSSRRDQRQLEPAGVIRVE
jgi:hypothetical protein